MSPDVKRLTEKREVRIGLAPRSFSPLVSEEFSADLESRSCKLGALSQKVGERLDLGITHPSFNPGWPILIGLIPL